MMNGTLVFDLETEKDFKEVGGKHNTHLLGVSVIGVFDYSTGCFVAYEKDDLKRVEDLFSRANLIVGFNIKHFDFSVLKPHFSLNTKELPALDLMDGVEAGLGFRASLDNLARATLGEGKSGHGLEAIEWWREGKKDKVKEYCLEDVRLTRDLYDFGRREGYVVCDTRGRGRVRIPVDWGKVLQLEKQEYVQRNLI